MSRTRLRTKFLLSMLLVTIGLTAATLLVVRDRVRVHVREDIAEGLNNSVATFEGAQRQREAVLARSAELIASLPSLKALMTTQHAATIQDGSRDLWRLSGSHLFVLSNRAGTVVAVHSEGASLPRAEAERWMQRSLELPDPGNWWSDGGRLYQVFLQPIYFGPPSEGRLLGVLALGHEIDEQAAQTAGRTTASKVAFRYGERVVIATLPAKQQADLATAAVHVTRSAVDIELAGERFLASAVELAPATIPRVSIVVMRSYDEATVFLDHLNRVLLALGVLAVAVGSALVFVISHTFTRPLGRLVAGVRALEHGDFEHPLPTTGSDEVAEVTAAFDRMRSNLSQMQRDLVAAERLATIGRMASSISHDLRHPLSAVVANAEFLAEPGLDKRERESLYHEVRVAVNQMTDLIDALLEFSRTRESLRPIYGSLAEAVERAIEAVRARPEFQRLEISVTSEGGSEAWFDVRRIERAFCNLLFNACEAAPAVGGRVTVNIAQRNGRLEARIADNGPGIPAAIRDRLFQPFVSAGKEDGIGLGLTIAQKIVQDHGGDVAVERTSEAGTVIRVELPPTFRPPASGPQMAESRTGPAKAPEGR